VNSPQSSVEKPRDRRVSKGALALMLAILGALALLAIFGNVQRLRQHQVETVVVTPASSPSPQTR
jgi:cell division septal protein FtsQ